MMKHIEESYFMPASSSFISYYWNAKYEQHWDIRLSWINHATWSLFTKKKKMPIKQFDNNFVDFYQIVDEKACYVKEFRAANLVKKTEVNKS